MKNKFVVALLMSVVLIMPNAVFAADNYASWAAPYIMQADELGLLTDNARKDYVKALTREEFCELAVTMYEKKAGPIEITSEPFTDTSNPMVFKAYSIGIVNGTGPSTFSPANTVTREQAAVMLVNAVRKIEEARGVSIYTEYADTLPFQDSGQISDWALDAMKVAYANGLMAGDGTNVRPLANVSCQECVILVMNAYNKEDAVPQDIQGWNPALGTDAGGGNTGVGQTQQPGDVQGQTPPGGSVTVVIDGGNIPLKLNGTVQLSYSLTPSDDVVTENVTWSSSSAKVATVSANGLVVAVGKGEAKITLKMTANGKSISATKTIYVDPPIVVLNNVIISNPVRTIKYGDTTTFNEQLSPTNATVNGVEWSSSNTGIATIDAKGKVTTKNSGTVTIKAVVTARDGSKKEATATLIITAPVSITSVTFGDVPVMFIGDSKTLSPKLEPKGYVLVSKTWKSSDPSVVYVSPSGSITAAKAGTAVITCETLDRAGTKCSGSVSVTVKDRYVSSFTMKNSYTIMPGETIYPELVTSPSTAIIKSVSFSFSSSPSGIASVSGSNRSVTGKKPGSGVLTVKVTFEDKSTHTAQADITVLPIDIQSVNFYADKPVLRLTGKSAEKSTRVRYEIAPKDASFTSVEFSSSDESVASVVTTSAKTYSGNRAVTAVGTGTCTIYMTIYLNDGTTRIESVSITVVD